MQRELFDLGISRESVTSSDETSGECSKPDCVKPNQPESCSILAATTCVVLGQLNSSWFIRFPWCSLCETIASEPIFEEQEDALLKIQQFEESTLKVFKA